VLKPAKTKDLYFVADGSGGHAFAASLDEHNKNVVKWRQVERALREQERAEAAAAAAAGTPSPDGSVLKTSPIAPATGTVPATGAAPGTLVAPDALVNLRSSAGISPEAAAPAGETGAEPEAAPDADAGAGMPLPRRNPLR
jgi:peptidoglycan lytic transglycosylase G